MAGFEAFGLLVVAFAIVAPLALYALVRSEHDRREEMDREAAEAAARRDTNGRDETR